MKRNQKKIFSKLLSFSLAISLMGGYAPAPETVIAAEQETGNQGIEELMTSYIEEIATNEIRTEEITSTSDNVEKDTTKQEGISETASAENPSQEPATDETPSKEPITTETPTEEPSTEEPTTIDPDAFTMIAHRGYSGYEPENSMPAFEKAIASGFKFIELDIVRTKPDASGKAAWVISHDTNLKSTMGVDKNISDLTYNEILHYSYTAGNNVAAHPNLKIVSLEQIISLMKDCKDKKLGIDWQIEIKKSEDPNFLNYFENEIVKPIKDANIQECISFSSFQYSYLKKIKEIDSSLHTWFLSTTLSEKAVDTYATQCQADGISFKGNVDNTKEPIIKYALSKGFKLGVYNVNTTVLMGTYYLWGVRYFVTDIVSPLEVNKGILKNNYNINMFSTSLAKTSYTYDGNVKQPKVSVKYRDVDLIEGVNYTVKYTNHKNPGTATVTVTGMNNCKGEAKLTFTITMPKVTGFKIPTVNTTSVIMSWNKVDNVTGYLVYKYNYTTKKYEKVATIANADTLTYKASKLTTATKYKYRVKAYVVADGKTYNADPCTAVTVCTKPAKVTMKPLTRYHSGTRIRVKWTKVPKCTGYTVQIATDKNFKKVVGTYNVKSSGKKLKIKKLSKNKKYYVRIRAYYKNGSKTYYGAYSKVKKSNKVK